jgi:hypothetical protein
MRAMIAKGAPEGLGLATASEVEHAALADDLPAYYMSSAELAQLTSSGDVRAALGPAHERIVPVVVDGAVRSLVEMSLTPAGEWKVTGMGRPKLAAALGATLPDVRARAGGGPVSMLNVPTRGLRFLVHEEGGEMMMTPVHDVAGTGLGAGRPMAAPRALAVLAATHRQP